MSDKTKEYLLSTAITFFTGFLIVVAPALDTLTLDSLQDGTLVGILFAGVRLGIKMVVQAILAKSGKVL